MLLAFRSSFLRLKRLRHWAILSTDCCYATPDPSEERVVYSLRCWESAAGRCQPHWSHLPHSHVISEGSPHLKNSGWDIKSWLLFSQCGISKGPFHPQGSQSLQWEFSFCLILLPVSFFHRRGPQFPFRSSLHLSLQLGADLRGQLVKLLGRGWLWMRVKVSERKRRN